MRKIVKTIACVASVLLLISLRVSAQENSDSLNIEQPPEGNLSETQLQKIAADIRKVESNPYANGVEIARSQLFKWLTESPDVSVSVCPEVIGPLLESTSKYKGVLLTQYLLSSAAYMIENDLAEEDQSAPQTGGIRGALHTYRVYKDKEGRSARDKFMEKMLELDNKDELTNYVQKGAEKCQ